ncbi:MAG TPA: histidine kinase [Blastocatellia bacterium]|nr:histidine kinase [Blastocatellia bacterium]
MHSASSPKARRKGGSVEDRMIAGMRLVLALSGLLIIWLDPVEPDRLVHVTYAALVLYTLYSAIICWLVWRSREQARRIRAWSYRADVASYALLVALSSGTNSIFFFGFFFAILTSSFRQGFKVGLRVTTVSVILFTTISLATAHLTPRFELNRFLLRPVDLAVLGYMISYWGGFHVRLSRRLALLKDVSRVSNPRFGLDRAIGSLLEQLRAFYDADACVFVGVDSETNEFVVRRAERRDPEAAARAEVIDPYLAKQLLGELAEQIVVHSDEQPRWWKLRRHNGGSDETRNRPELGGSRAIQSIANLLDSSSFVSVPLLHGNKAFGRLYLTARPARFFDGTDQAFLMQVSEHVVPVLENIRLAHRLAGEAAEDERKRIARDIHDSIIQPYIGLQIGLAGVRQKLAVDGIDIGSDGKDPREPIRDAGAAIERLLEMTGDGISDLRRYVHGLREGGDSEDTLMPAVRRFAAKFTQATNIVVQVRADSEIQVDDRLGTEIFQMIVEGLSNIRRHTQSERAFIGFEVLDGRLTMRIENDGTRGSVPKPFTPRSIIERVEALGGRAHVETFGDIGTSVIVEVPL